MRIVLSGMSGAAGSVLAKLLTQAGHTVIPFDRSRPEAADRFLHLAAKSTGSAEDIVRSNVLLTIDAINYCGAAGISQLIFFSGMSVYGSPNARDIGEEHPLSSPGLYGASKLLAERALEASNLSTLVLRLPAILTHRVQSNIISRWYQALRRNEAISISNAEELFNNFIPIEDIFRFLESLEVVQRFDVIHLAAEQELRLRNAVEILKDATGSESAIHSGPPSGFFNISIEKAKRHYGFRPAPAEAALRDWCRRISATCR